MKFNTSYINEIKEVIEEKSDKLDEVYENQTRYKELFQEHPFQQKDHSNRLMGVLIKDDAFKQLFEL